MYFLQLKPFLFLLISCFAISVSAQTTTIKGIVKDHKSNPLPGASISLQDTYDGATADSSGKYSFRTTETGEQVLVFSSIGYLPVEQKIKLVPGVMEINISLK